MPHYFERAAAWGERAGIGPSASALAAAAYGGVTHLAAWSSDEISLVSFDGSTWTEEGSVATSAPNSLSMVATVSGAHVAWVSGEMAAYSIAGDAMASRVHDDASVLALAADDDGATWMAVAGAGSAPTIRVKRPALDDAGSAVATADGPVTAVELAIAPDGTQHVVWYNNATQDLVYAYR
jgi:hypothetical protein